jgi:hypothetical protein
VNCSGLTYETVLSRLYQPVSYPEVLPTRASRRSYRPEDCSTAGDDFSTSQAVRRLLTNGARFIYVDVNVAIGIYRYVKAVSQGEIRAATWAESQLFLVSILFARLQAALHCARYPACALESFLIDGNLHRQHHFPARGFAVFQHRRLTGDSGPKRETLPVRLQAGILTSAPSLLVGSSLAYSAKRGA